MLVVAVAVELLVNSVVVQCSRKVSVAPWKSEFMLSIVLAWGVVKSCVVCGCC